jgi:hypothetical protein
LVTYYPNHKEQFAPAMSVDEKTGDVCILYYDRQNFPSGELTDIVLAVSKNGGLKFDYYKLNEKPFSLSQRTLPEYLGITSVNGEVRPLWAEPKNKKMQAYTAEVNRETIAKSAAKNVKEIEMEKTFNFSQEIKINFTLMSGGEVTAVLTKPVDPGFEKKIRTKKFRAGKNSITINTGKMGLKKESYILTLYCNNQNTYAWIVDE